MKKKILILIVLILAAGLNAQKKGPASGSGGFSKQQYNTEIKIDADDQHIDDNKLVASGNVEISWEDYRIYADYVEFNQDTKQILARGRVTMSSKETVISGEQLTFNLKDRTGEMSDTYGQLPPTVRYTTDKLTQTDNDTLTFKKLDFTSCTQCVPRWKITCTKGKIKKDKYIEMTNTLFKIKKIPVFYLPYIRYPINKEGRATGILMPNFGTSSVRGFFLLNAFYWAIKQNVDLTLGVDYYAKAGLGLSQEFRYLFRFMEGEVKFYYFKYKGDNILNTDATSDYFLRMKHRQNFNFLNTRISVDIDRQSDANFLRLFSNNFDSVLTRISRSSVSLSSSFANVKFSIGGMRNDTYYTFSNKSNSVKYLPKISLNWNHQKLWLLPGYFSVDASYATISRVGKSYQEDEEKLITDVTSTRMSINPSYSLNLIKLPWFGASLSLSSRNSFYPKSRDPNVKDVVIVNEPLHLGYQVADVSFKGPVFAKIFEFRNSKLKHLIEPKIVFRYTTKVDEEDRDRLIPVDNFDYPSYSFVRFELGTRLLYKNKKEESAGRPSSPVEILSLTVRQEYYFDPQLANRDRKINDAYPEFSQLENTLRVRPFKNFSLDASLIYNHYRKEFTRSRIALSYNNRNSFISGNFFYDTYINQYAASTYELNRESIGGRLNLEIPRFPLKFISNINYDITDREFRLGSFLLSYDYQCIQIRGELKLFRYSGRVETQFNFGISFGNLGQVKDFLGIEK
jgi:LPS-assembly protein